MSARAALVVFVRAPELGRVKTRLAAGVGAERALAIYRALAEGTVAAAAAVEPCEVTLAYTPADAESHIREWLGGRLGPGTALRPQREGDLGARMTAAVDEALSAGAQRVVVVGTDCPDLTAERLTAALDRLDGVDVVLGPAADGGYYLIGMNGPQAGLFADVPWSSTDTLRVTLERARALGLSVALLDELRDIDTAGDWYAWVASQGQGAGTE